MKIKRFEDLKIWQQARLFSGRLYKLTYSGIFTKDYNLTNQLQRAGISIMANIAEGFERKTKKEFIQFLYISKGSAGEIRSLLYLAKDLEYLDDKKFNIFYEDIVSISKSIAGFIRYLKNDLRLNP